LEVRPVQPRAEKIYPIAFGPIERETREVRVAPLPAAQINTAPEITHTLNAVNLLAKDIPDDHYGRGFRRREPIEEYHAAPPLGSTRDEVGDSYFFFFENISGY
jgi:hypothetical protein